MHKYVEILVIIGSLGAMMWGMLRFMLKDIHKDLESIGNKIDKLETRLDKSETRIDHLYQICIEMLGDRHK